MSYDRHCDTAVVNAQRGAHEKKFMLENQRIPTYYRYQNATLEGREKFDGGMNRLGLSMESPLTGQISSDWIIIFLLLVLVVISLACHTKYSAIERMIMELHRR